MTTTWLLRPEGGGELALRTIRRVAMLFGRGAARAILYPVAAYFVFRRAPERRASRAFLSCVPGRRATLAEVFRHFLCFATVTLDRVFLLSDRFRRFDVRCYGLDELHRAIDLGRGVLLFGAHFGSFDALRVLSLQREDLTFRVVIDLDQNPTVSRLLSSLNPDLATTVINARQAGPTVALAIHDALATGGLVTLLVDRARPGNRVLQAEFFGQRAGFPTAAWEMAAALHAPVVLCFGIYRGRNRYDLHFELSAEEVTCDRRNREAEISERIREFAERLEEYVRKAPYNWFNFYDFWAS